PDSIGCATGLGVVFLTSRVRFGSISPSVWVRRPTRRRLVVLEIKSYCPARHRRWSCPHCVDFTPEPRFPDGAQSWVRIGSIGSTRKPLGGSPQRLLFHLDRYATSRCRRKRRPSNRGHLGRFRSSLERRGGGRMARPP